MKTGIIVKPSVWIYEENLRAVIDEVFMGWAVGIIRENGDWAEIVTHYGYHGYIKKEGVCFCEEKFLKRRDGSRQTTVTIKAFTDIMGEPMVNSEILFTLHRGSFLTVAAESQNGYQKVIFADGKEGYAPRISCKGRKDNDGYLYTDEKKDYFLRQEFKDMDNEWDFRKRIVSCARSYLGTQYRWAGKSAEGIDCSGFTFMCYLMNGSIIYRDAKLKTGYPMHEISFDRAKPGDLLYFPGHVAMYLGNGAYIHATGNEKSFGCRMNSLYEKDASYRDDLAKSLLAVGSIW